MSGITSEYDESTAFLGHWGRFQQIVFFLLCASMIPNGIVNLSIVFLADIPSHHCLIPEVNLTQEWLDAIIPVKVVNGKQEQSRCSRYRLDVVRNLSAQGLVPGRDVNLIDLEQEVCVDGWSYSRDVYQSTIVSEFDLVCDDHWKQPFTSTVYFIGILVGSFISGQLSDRYGRKPVLFVTMGVMTIFTFAQIFSPSWTVFAILLFFNGLGQIANYVAAFVLGSEILTGNIRVMFSSLGVGSFFSSGYMLLPLFAYCFRDWKSLLVAVSLPGLLCGPLWWFIPESPRWLISQGRVEEAEAIVRDAAKKNKVEAPQIIFQDCSTDEKNAPCKGEERLTIFDIIRKSSIRATTAILCLVWFTLSIGYYGLSLNTSNLTGDPYIGCLIAAAVDVVAYSGSWPLLRYFPRRLSGSFMLLLGGLCLYFLQLVPQSLLELSVALEMLGKGALSTTSSMIFVYTGELYPTALRNTAMGTCSTFSRIGGCLAPFVLQLSVYSKFLPQISMGTLAVLSAISMLMLPESFGQPLPQTLQQMQKRESIKCPCFAGKETTKPVMLLETRL